MRARYYNPEIGRFISEDPVKDGLNWYACASGNPVNNIDPYGTFSLTNEQKILIGIAGTTLAVMLTVATGGVALSVLMAV